MEGSDRWEDGWKEAEWTIVSTEHMFVRNSPFLLQSSVLEMGHTHTPRSPVVTDQGWLPARGTCERHSSARYLSFSLITILNHFGTGRPYFRSALNLKTIKPVISGLRGFSG